MPVYDVFLSHNSTDKPVVESLTERLIDAGLKPWLDKWNLTPGEPWQEELEDALDACQTVAVFLGPLGISPWENEEMRSALEVRVHNKTRRVIPVLLPGAPDPQDRPLPRFLRRLTWVDFRNGLDENQLSNAWWPGYVASHVRASRSRHPLLRQVSLSSNRSEVKPWIS